MTKKRLVIVGNGMATGRLLDEILRRTPNKFNITVIGDEVHGSYNRIMLSPVLAEESTVEAIVQKSREWFEDNHIHFLAGFKVARIYRDKQCVALDSGDIVHYDDLILAMGSRPAKIAALNQLLANIHSFRTIDDVQCIAESAFKAESAVVVGGGLLGLEAAYGLAKKGVPVTLVHRSASLLNRQLDPSSGLLLQQVMSEKNIRFELAAEVEHFIGDDRVDGVLLNNGRRIDCQLVVIATGITPNKELGEEAGLVCARAICVDDFMSTSDHRISAIGECCEHRGATFGLVEPIWGQCVSLAEKLCFAHKKPFKNSDVATKLKVSGVHVFSAGAYLARENQREIVMQDARNKIYRKLIIEDGAIVGIVLFGDTRCGSDYFELMHNAVDVSNALPNIILGKAFLPPLEAVLARERFIAA
jgi:nitrite reductase (NADH) large subunit